MDSRVSHFSSGDYTSCMNVSKCTELTHKLYFEQCQKLGAKKHLDITISICCIL